MCGRGVSSRRSPVGGRFGSYMSSFMARAMLSMAVLVEHFGLLPGLLFTTEIGSEHDGKGGEGDRLFHGEQEEE